MDSGVIFALAALERDPASEGALADLRALAKKAKNGEAHSFRAAVREARRVHGERGEHRLVAQLVDVELECAEDASDRAALYLDKGRVLFEELTDEEGARAALTAASELKPDDMALKERLLHLEKVRAIAGELEEKYLREAEAATDRQLKSMLYLAAADTGLRYHLDEARIEANLRKALDIDPRSSRASVRLEARYLAAQNVDGLRKLYLGRVDVATSRDERVTALGKLAELELGAGSRDKAAERYRALLQIDSSLGTLSRRALDFLVEFHRQRNELAELASAYELALRGRPHPDVELTLLTELGTLLGDKLNQADEAEEVWKRVRKLDPLHAGMLTFFRTRYAGQAARLLPVLQAAQKIEPDPQKRRALSVEMARLSSSGAGSTSAAGATSPGDAAAQMSDKSPERVPERAPERAIDLWRVVLKNDPDSAEAFGELRSLYRQAEKWTALVELLKEHAERLSHQEGGAIDERIALLEEVV